MALSRVSSAMTSYTSTASGAAARTARARLDDEVSVKDFGALGDGSTNDAAAFQAAIDSGRDVYVPAGTYVLTSALTITNRSISIYGAGAERTILRFNGCNGFVVNNNAASPLRHVSLSDMTLMSNSDSLYTAFDMTGPSSSDVGQQLTIDNVQFRGIGYSYCWQYGVKLNSVRMVQIRGCYFLGRTEADQITRMEAAVRLTGNSHNVKILGCDFYHLNIGVYIAGTAGGTSAAEGVVVRDSHFVPVAYGVWSYGNTGNYIAVVDNHISATTRGVLIGTPINTGESGAVSAVPNSAHSQIRSNNIQKDAHSTADFVGIECFGPRSVIDGNTVRQESAGNLDGSETGIAVGYSSGGGVEPHGAYCSVVNNKVFAMNTGIWLRQTARYCTVIGNTGGNNATNYLNQVNDDSGLDPITVGGGGMHTVESANIFDDAVGSKYPRSAIVGRGTNLTVGDSVVNVIPFENEWADYGNIANLSGNPYRLTVPGGVSRVKLAAQVNFTCTGLRSVTAYIRKNGSNDYAGQPVASFDNGGSATGFTSCVLNLSMPCPIDVDAGDYFDVVVYHTAGGTNGTINGDATGRKTWAALEVIE